MDSFFENRDNDSMFSMMMMMMMMMMMVIIIIIIIIITIIKSDKFTFSNPRITVQLLEFKPRKAQLYCIVFK